MRALLLRSYEYAATPALPRYARVLTEVLGKDQVDALCWRTNPRFATPIAADEPARVVHYARTASSRSASGVLGLPLWLMRIVREIRARRYGLIQASDLFALLPCVMLKPFHGFILVGDVRDHTSSMVGTHWGVKARVLGWLEDFLLSRCDAVIVVDDTRRELLPASVTLRRRVIVVRNLPQFDVGVSTSHEEGGVTVNYSGYLSALRGGGLLAEAVGACAFTRLDVVGETNDSELAKALELTPRVTRHGRVSHGEAMRRMGVADVVALLYDPSVGAHRYAAPNKFYEAMMVGRPVLVAEGTPMAEWVRAADCGYCVRYGDTTAIVSVLAAINSDRSGWRRKCTNARALYEKEFLWPNEARRLVAEYQALGVRPRAADPGVPQAHRRD